MNKNRIASRTLIERGDVELGVIRRAAAFLRRSIETGNRDIRNRMDLVRDLRLARSYLRHTIEADVARGKYSTG